MEIAASGERARELKKFGQSAVGQAGNEKECLSLRRVRSYILQVHANGGARAVISTRTNDGRVQCTPYNDGAENAVEERVVRRNEKAPLVRRRTRVIASRVYNTCIN